MRALAVGGTESTHTEVTHTEAGGSYGEREGTYTHTLSDTCSPVTVTSSCDFNVLDALSGELEVMLVHAVNGGYLKSDVLDHNNHSSEARPTKTLDNNTIDKKGHLWYLTPAIFADWLQKMTYYIESAASEEVSPDDPDTSKRRRITHHVNNPTGNGVAVGSLNKLPTAYQFKEDGKLFPLSQCWILTLTSCGGLISRQYWIRI